MLTLPGVDVTFYKLPERRVSYWEAVRRKGQRVPGSFMALGRGDMPHDLKQMVVEATLGLPHGFWGCVADGATFRSTGRKRTQPGRSVIRQHTAELEAAEAVAGEEVRRWQRGEPTESGRALDSMNAQWEALAGGEGVTVRWPSLEVLATVTYEVQ